MDETATPTGCAGLFQLYANGEGVPRDRARALAVGNRACELGHAAVCRALGGWANRGADGPENPTRAATLFARACELGDITACGELG